MGWSRNPKALDSACQHTGLTQRMYLGFCRSQFASARIVREYSFHLGDNPGPFDIRAIIFGIRFDFKLTKGIYYRLSKI